MNAHRQVSADEPVRVVAPPPRFVSRAGFKLEAALDTFGVDPAGRMVLDVGSSTGGFTECLLMRGARQVHAVDVGTNQMHERVASDQRVTLRERTDIRKLRRSDIPAECDLVTVDVSFISVASLAHDLLKFVEDAGDLLVLVKPQFEATRREADRSHGVIVDAAIWGRVLGDTIIAFRSAGAGMMGVMASPVRGSSGNVEFFVHLRPSAEVRDDRAIAASVRHAIEGVD